MNHIIENKVKEITINSKTVYQGHLINVEISDVKLSNGKVVQREITRHPGAVCVVPLLANGNILVEYQWRAAYGGMMLEIPAGKLNSKEENPLEAAKRELQEETGAIAQKMTCLGKYYGSPAIFDECITMYLAEDIQFGETNYDEDELMVVEEKPLEELVDLIIKGEIPDGKTQTAILRVKELLERRKKDV